MVLSFLDKWRIAYYFFLQVQLLERTGPFFIEICDLFRILLMGSFRVLEFLFGFLGLTMKRCTGCSRRFVLNME